MVIDSNSRTDAHNWATQVLREPNVVFLDTETTGLGEDAEIIDIAIVDREGQVLLDTLVRPSDMIPVSATDIHGIDDPAVADAPGWDTVYPLVGRILDQYGPVVVYNSDFDRRVLSQTNALYGLPDFSVEWHCAMRQHAAYVGVWHEKYGTWRWHKLMDALRMMGGQAPGVQHRALQDTEACRQIVHAMAGGVSPQRPGMSDSPAVFPAEPDTGEHRDEPIRPDVIGPEDDRFGDDPRGWETRSGTFAGGQYTVISTKAKGCSPGLLTAILIGGTIAILVGCCFFLYAGAQLVF